MSKLLLVEDDLPLALMIETFLQSRNYTVEHATAVSDGLTRLLVSAYDLLIVDWNLPDDTGLALVKEFRGKGGQAPVLFLTGRGAIADKLQAFNHGADDYLTKPFDVQELLVRVQSLLRRPPQIISSQLCIGDLVLNPDSRQVLKAGKEITLLPKEFELLHFFMRNPDKVFSSTAIIAAVWRSDSPATDHTFRQCLLRLRQKIDGGAETLIRNIHGVGYRLATETGGNCRDDGEK